jgi:hypothetical protein
MSIQVGLRGKAWFEALTGKNSPMAGDPDSVHHRLDVADRQAGLRAATRATLSPNSAVATIRVR